MQQMTIARALVVGGIALAGLVACESPQGPPPVPEPVEKETSTLPSTVENETSSRPESVENRGEGTWLTTLEGGVRAEVIAVRSWRPPGPKFKLLKAVPDGSHYYIKMNNMSIGGGPSPIVRTEGQAQTSTLLRDGTKFAEFSRRCVKIEEPRGRWLEALLHFSYSGDQKVTQSITSSEKGVLDIQIRAESHDEFVAPVDFVSQGLSNSRLEFLEELASEGLTVASEFDGDIQIYLEPEGQSWLLLLYDIDEEARSASLRIAGSEAISVSW